MSDEAQTHETIDYRLSNIEKTLNELKDVVLENRLLAKDIEIVKEDIDTIHDRLDSQSQKIRNIELSPYKDKAEKWERYVKIVMELVLSAAVVVVLAKIGLK